MFTETPQKMVTSQSTLHLRSPIWQDLDSLKASKRNISYKFLIRPFLWIGGWKPGGPEILGMSFKVPQQQLHLHCQMQGLAQTGKSQCCAGMCNPGRAPGDQAPAQAGPWKSPEPMPWPLRQKWQAHAEWGHRAALTAGTENHRAPARGEGKAGFLLCIHKQWLPAKN